MDEFLGVAWADYLREGKKVFGDVRALLAATRRHQYFAWLVAALYRVEDDILLQHAVHAEGGSSGFEDMEAAEFQSIQEILSKGTKVRAVAKAPWRDPYELTSRGEQALDERYEASVKVARFHADGTQGMAFARVNADFAIRWINDGGVELGRVCAEQIASKAGRHLLNEIGGMNGERETNPRTGAQALALTHGHRQPIQDLVVEFVERRFDSTNTFVLSTKTGHESRGECTRPCASVEQPDCSRERPKHRRHEIGHLRGGKELPEFFLPFPRIGNGRKFHVVMLPN